MTPPHLYIHTVYCRTKCPYCDFLCTTHDRLPPASQYVDALIRDLDALEGEFETIFIGGGTPTELPMPELERLTAQVAARLAPGGEWTVEANPKSFTAEVAGLLRERGVTRISLGMQSAQDAILEHLGRAHRHEDNVRAVELLKEFAFPRCSADMIYGLPGEVIDATVTFYVESGFAHVSAYELTVEGGSRWKKDGYDPSVPDEEKLARLERIAASLSAAGLNRYEVANFARPGHECRHNLNTWRCGEYAAIGAGACGYENGARYRISSSIESYIAEASRQIEPIGNLAAETMMLIMRMPAGVAVTDLPESRVRALEEIRPALERLERERYIVQDAGRIAPTAQGLRFLNSVVMELM